MRQPCPGIYATGHSYGGLFTYALGIDYYPSREQRHHHKRKPLGHRFAALAPVAGGILKGFAPQESAAATHYNSTASPATSAAAASPPPRAAAIMDIHGWFDPWVPANDTHGCVAGGEEEPGCSGGGDGYSWPASSEAVDGWAKSNDGWLYTPVEQLLGWFARHRQPPLPLATQTGERLRWGPWRTAWDGKDALHCVTALPAMSNKRGSDRSGDDEVGGDIVRCDWRGGHSYPPGWGTELVWWFLSRHVHTGPFPG